MSELCSFLRYICCIYYILLIYLSINKHLGCFHILLMEIMFQWTRMCKYLFKILRSIFRGIYLEAELLGHLVILFLIFCRTTILFSTTAVSFSTPINSAQKFQFFYIITNTFYFLFFFNSTHTNGCWVLGVLHTVQILILYLKYNL